jgi:predicted transposase YbfD/YdcC
LRELQGVSKLIKEVGNISDPRRPNGNLRHPFVSIIVSAIMAVLSGSDSWEDISRYVNRNFKWFKNIVPLPNGAPSPDTYSRIFTTVKHSAFEDFFLSWVKSMQGKLDKSEYQLEHIALDGKTVRRSHNLNAGIKPLHIVSAYSSSTRLVLAQQVVDEKSNEIKAIPKLIDSLDLKRSVVTIDAMGCQQKIATKIIKNHGEYLLALKNNQGLTYDLVLDFFNKKASERWWKYTTTSKNLNHGRDEERIYYASEELNKKILIQMKWSKLKSVIMVEAKRLIKGKLSSEKRYYISSLPAKEINFIGDSIRNHWSVENSLHWVLDVVFREDECRKREKNSAKSFSLLRKFALNTLKTYQLKSNKQRSLRILRKECGWDPNFMLEVLGF